MSKFAARSDSFSEITIEDIFNAMMSARGECEGNTVNIPLAARLERRLHDALKAEYLDEAIGIHTYSILVTPLTPAGKVEVRVELDGSNTVDLTRAETADTWEDIHAAHPEPAVVA